MFKKTITISLISLALVFATQFSVANAQVSNQLWKAISGTLQPVLDTFSLKVPSLGGSGVKCLQVDDNGLFGTSSSACGSGGGSSVGWASSTNPTSIYFTGSGNVGIGTTSPYAKLSVVGETVSSYFTATSTTATSTFAGVISTRDIITKGPIIDVRAYGAIGNGTTNDSAAISAAIAAIPSTGGTVYFPCGVYKIGSNIPFSNSFIRFTGNGDCSVLKTFTDIQMFTLLGLTGDWYYPNAQAYVTFENLRFTSNTVDQGAAISTLQNTMGLTVQNCRFDNLAKGIQFLYQGYATVIDKNFFQNNRYSIFATGAVLHDFRITNNKEMGWELSGYPAYPVSFIKVSGTGDTFEWVIANNSIEHVQDTTGTSISVDIGATSNADIQFLNNNVETYDTALRMSGVFTYGQALLSNFQIVGNTFRNDQTQPATSTLLEGTSTSMIANNQYINVFEYAKSAAIEAKNVPAGYIKVSDNSILGYPNRTAMIPTGTTNASVFKYNNVIGDNNNTATSSVAYSFGNLNVGIGTTTPSNSLTVLGTELTGGTITGTGQGVARISGGTYNHLDVVNLDFGMTSFSPAVARIGAVMTDFGSSIAFGNSTNFSSGITNERMRIQYDGNVGIGTSTPTTALQVGGILGQQFNVDVGTANYVKLSADRGLRLSSNAGYSTSFMNGALTYMTIEGTTGNVGIGTTSPYAKLSVVGPVVAEYFHATSTIATSSFAGGLNVGGASGLTVLQNRLVGIGTASPGTSLEIGGSYVTNKGQVYINSADHTYLILKTNTPNTKEVGVNFIGNSTIGFYQPANSTDARFANGGDRMTITSTGNVGIGTSTPATKLNVLDTTGAVLQLQRNDGSVLPDDLVGGLNFYEMDADNRSNFGALGVYSEQNIVSAATTDSYMSFSTALDGTIAEKMRITSGGNVGIGTTTPIGKFHVTAGQSATTTITVGELGSVTSKTCVNMKNTDGADVSWYIVGTTQVIENNPCR